MTKIKIFSALLIVLSIIAVLVTVLPGRKDKEPQPQPSTSGISKVFEQNPVLSAIPTANQSAVWFFNQTGRLFRYDLTTNQLTEFSLPPVSGEFRQSIWPAVGSDFIVFSLVNGFEVKKYYNYSDKNFFTLPENVKSIDWLPDGKRVVYIWQSGDNKQQHLIVANPDTSGFKVIREVFWPDLTVKASPDGRRVLLLRSEVEETNKIYLADINTGVFETLIDEGKNVGVSWIGSDKFLFAQQLPGQAYPKLFLYNFNNKIPVDLNIKSTLEKVMYDKDSLYAAVPKKDNSGDSFIKVNLTTFQQSIFYEPETSVRAKNLFFAQGKLFFVSTSDNSLYQITVNR